MSIEKTYTTLVISPHADDEVLGCYSILDENTFVYYCGLDEQKLPNYTEDKNHRLSLSNKIHEINDVSNFLGFSWDYNKEQFVNNYVEIELIKVFEELINKIRPTTVVIPAPSYNQDHRAVYNAAIIALRPHDQNFFVKKVILTEQPQDLHWGKNQGHPNFFIEIDIERKLKSYSLYKSQVRDMRSPDLIKGIGTLRGSYINKPYAEGFKILRWMD